MHMSSSFLWMRYKYKQKEKKRSLQLDQNFLTDNADDWIIQRSRESRMIDENDARADILTKISFD